VFEVVTVNVLHKLHTYLRTYGVGRTQRWALLQIFSSRSCAFAGGGFFGQNVEIFIGDDDDRQGTPCAYGPTSDRQSEYTIHCFSGAMSGRVVTIQNRFTGSLKLCDVQVFGDYVNCFCC